VGEGLEGKDIGVEEDDFGEGREAEDVKLGEDGVEVRSTWM
jgi:hypothetical protein